MVVGGAIGCSAGFVRLSGEEIRGVTASVARMLEERTPSWIDRELLSFLTMQETLWVHEGDLIVEGSFRPPYAAIVVTGDLLVSGSIFTGFRGGPSSTFLLVVGHVRCSSLLVEHEATTVIAGGLTAREAVIAHKVADTATYVGRALTADCVVEGNGADIRVEDAIVTVRARIDDVDAPMWHVFPPELLELEFDFDELLRREREGEDVVDFVDLDRAAIVKRLEANDSLDLRR